MSPSQSICFSPDGRWLLSLGRDPERSVVVWDVLHGLLVAAGRTEQSPAAAEWLCGGDHPVFATVGSDGLMLWTLQDRWAASRRRPACTDAIRSPNALCRLETQRVTCTAVMTY